MAFFTEACKINLVQDHRVGSDQLLALEAIDNEDWGLAIVELRQLFTNCVQPFDRARVIVFVVAGEEFLREALDLRRTKGSGLIAYDIGFGPVAGGVCAMAGALMSEAAASAALDWIKVRLARSVDMETSIRLPRRR